MYQRIREQRQEQEGKPWKPREKEGQGQEGRLGSPKGAMVRHTAQEEVPPRDAGILLRVRVGIGEGTVVNL